MYGGPWHEFMTLLVTSILPANLSELSANAERAWAGRTDAIEVRIDRFADDFGELAAYLRVHQDKTWIVTCRSTKEGGQSPDRAGKRAAKLSKSVGDSGVFVDFEFADWVDSDEARTELLGALANSTGDAARLILSAHDFGNDSTGKMALPAKLPDMLAVSETACAKIAYKVDHIADSFAALDAIREGGQRVSAMAMGEAGLWTRVLAGKLGAFATYCALDAESATAPGQLTLEEMVNRYRWHDLTEATRVFGVIGDPVGHSMGPLLFNRWFAEAGIDAVYLPLLVGRSDDGLRRFLDGCMKRPWLDLGGLSVTIPHKTAALEWIGDGADAMATGIGAINTLCFDRETVTGCNTDSYAAVASLVDALGCDRSDLSGVTVDILGAGGAARAIMHGLDELGCAMTVFGRSEAKTSALAEAHRAKAKAWEERARRSGDILINCTNLGMWPNLDESPMSPDQPRRAGGSARSLHGCRLVFDLVYHPLETKLLRDAKAAGANVLTGLDMFIRQASMQFELWTGKQPDRELGRELITHPGAPGLAGEIQKRSESRQ